MPKDIIYLKNRPEFIAVMNKLKAAPSGNALVSIATAAILPIQNAAIGYAPKLTGTLSRSIHTEPVRVTQHSAFVVTGTDVDYAARQEYGFNDTDTLGRTYHQPAHPYMRPAYADQRDAAIEEATLALKALIRSVT